MNIIITGASRGIGKAIAERFARDDKQHNLVLTATDPQKLEATAKQLEQQYPKNNYFHKTCDLSNAEDVSQLSRWILSRVDKIDILVNNAGSFLPGNISDEPSGTLEKMIAVNLYSAYYLTRALIPTMKTNHGGHIFNMCSIAGLQAYDNGGSYSISKFALIGFSKNLRQELLPHGIKVTTIYPGAVFTDSWSGSGVPPQRIMEANDIAELIYSASLLSPQACVEDIIVRPQQGDL